MKKLRKVKIAASLLLCSTLITYGQKTYHDSISVHIDDKMEINMTVYDFKALGENVEKDLKTLQSILKTNSDIAGKVTYSIFYKPDKSMSIKQTGPGERIFWENEKQIRYKFNNQCFIDADKYQMQIQFDEFERLISDSLIFKIKEVIETTNSVQGGFSATYNYSYQEGKLVHNKQLDRVNGQMDAISLKGGVGVNMIKNQPVIDLSAEVGFTFSKKGIWKNQYYLSYNQLSDFDENSKINPNGFINAGYRRNLSNTVGKSNWLGVELGFIVSRNGNLFEKNTFRLGVNWEIGKYMSVSPQLYFSKNMSYPALRIGFGF